MRLKANATTVILAGLLLVALAVAGWSLWTMRNVESRAVPISRQIAAGETDPAAFGAYYPLEYDSYQQNYEMSRAPSRYGGSEPYDRLAEYPYMKTLWQGYSFAKGYHEDRGHVYSLQDVKSTPRNPTQAVCLTCKSTEVPGLLAKYDEAYFSKPFAEVAAETVHPIGCSDCHDPQTMDLRITRPAFREAMGRRGVDVDRATRREMRTYVCAQCHVEYYFQPGTSVLTFPWDKGFDPEAEYAYYQEKGLHDWVHPGTGTPLLKAQHPDFEVFQGSTHQAAGLACADCHMPYRREGNIKITSHWWTSPLRHLDGTCTVCHTEDTELLKERVFYTQDQVKDLLDRAGNALAGTVEALEKARSAPQADPALVEKAQALHREAQWYWDWCSAENSTGFHNPQKIMATLGRAIDLAHQARTAALSAVP